MCLKRLFIPVFLLQLILFLGGNALAQSQTTIEIVNSDVFLGDESLGKGVSLLKGNVAFRHRGALMYCDSAYLYQESNSLNAFGKVRILQGDTIKLTGSKLNYNGNSGLAVITGQVVLTDRKTTLTSEELTYDMSKDLAFYLNRGALADGENDLTSKRGYYYSKQSRVFFSDSVLLVNPKYRVVADSLSYLTKSATVLFSGPTRISSTGADSTWIQCENGFYDTKQSKSRFYRPNKVVSGSKLLSGDTLDFDNNTRKGRASGRVLFSDTTQSISISGDRGFSDEKKREAFVTGNAELIRYFDKDTLFLHADTLYAREDTVAVTSSWIAIRNVRFYKSDLQGSCDSLSYSTPDSMLVMNYNPVLWSDSNQITAGLIQMRLLDAGPQYMKLETDPFICSLVDSIHFNQISGRTMDGFFTDGSLTSVMVYGNGQSVYFTEDKKGAITGVNVAECSDMRILLVEQKVSEIILINEPDATLYPLSEAPQELLMLKGLDWKDSLRPKDRADIFKRNASNLP
jgi:lipopolysaccharide export system protein LptA